MSLALITTGRSNQKWVDEIKKQAPDLQLQVYPDITDPESVVGALCWKHPHGSLQEFPNLQWITSLGAGVDHVLSDPELPEGVPVTRIVDKRLAMDISRTAIMGVIGFEKQMPKYIRQKRVGVWAQHPPERLTTVGVLGLGEMGKKIAKDLVHFGYEVNGFSRSPKDITGVATYDGSEIPTEFLEDLDVLINVLPLTPETENILNADVFQRMKQGAYIINLGRGKNLVEDDLLDYLHKGHLGGAFLDVFRAEPLPAEHPYWNEDLIVVTPHIASITDPESAVHLILDNYQRILDGKELKHVVKRGRGY